MANQKCRNCDIKRLLGMLIYMVEYKHCLLNSDKKGFAFLLLVNSSIVTIVTLLLLYFVIIWFLISNCLLLFLC